MNKIPKQPLQAKFIAIKNQNAAATWPAVVYGCALLSLGLLFPALAQDAPGLPVAQGDYRIFEMSARMFDLIEGNLGALVMVVAGLAAIISAAFGVYRAALSLLIVAVSAFILRSLVEIFFNFE